MIKGQLSWVDIKINRLIAIRELAVRQVIAMSPGEVREGKDMGGGVWERERESMKIVY